MKLPPAHDFLTRLFERLPDLSHLEVDHLCYRVETLAEYQALKQELERENDLLAETQIGGRPISTFRLTEPVTFGARRIPLLELPAPKPGRPYPAGYDHIEFVTDRPLTAFVNYLQDECAIPKESLDLRGIDKQHNADIRLQLGDGMSVKFHEQPLDRVIEMEKS